MYCMCIEWEVYNTLPLGVLFVQMTTSKYDVPTCHDRREPLPCYCMIKFDDFVMNESIPSKYSVQQTTEDSKVI
jgi:hypothetical protein